MEKHVLVSLPMEHDPLCGRCNTLMALVQGRQLGEHGVVGVRHFGRVL